MTTNLLTDSNSARGRPGGTPTACFRVHRTPPRPSPVRPHGRRCVQPPQPLGGLVGGLAQFLLERAALAPVDELGRCAGDPCGTRTVTDRAMLGSPQPRRRHEGRCRRRCARPSVGCRASQRPCPGRASPGATPPGRCRPCARADTARSRASTSASPGQPRCGPRARDRRRLHRASGRIPAQWGRATLRRRRGRASRRRRAGVTEDLGAEMLSVPLIFGGQVVVEAPGLRPQPVQRIVDLHARRAHPLLPTRLPAAWPAIVAGSRRPRTSTPPAARRTGLRGRDVTRSTEPARASSGAAAGCRGRASSAVRLGLAGEAWSRPLRGAGRPAPARDWRRAFWAR